MHPYVPAHGHAPRSRLKLGDVLAQPALPAMAYVCLLACLAALCACHGVGQPPADPGRHIHGASPPGCSALRTALRDLLKLRSVPDAGDRPRSAGSSGDAVTGTLPRVNGTLHAHLLRLQASPDGTPALIPASGGNPASLAAISATMALAQTAGTLHRLKICASLDCRWVFNDTSRSGAARWCSMRVCGNPAKTRAYRQRHL